MKNPIFVMRFDRVFRGGAWGNTPNALRSERSDFVPPSLRNSAVGFRIFRIKDES